MNLAPLQSVELVQGGRPYGRPTLSLKDRSVIEPAPEIGKIFVGDLASKSSILKLGLDADRAAILAAYGADIKALAERRREADEFMRSILKCGMSRFSIDYDQRQREWELLQKLLEPLGILPQISLSAERCALPPEELVEWLKGEFAAETDRIARRVATTLHYLADHSVIGLTEWKSPDVCKFHYFSWDVEHEQRTSSANQSVSRESNGVVWVSYEQTTEATATLIRTKHTHHVVDAAYHDAGDYKRPIPERVRDLLASAPVWLKQSLLVLDGTETLSERTVAIADKASVTTHSVVRYDPAIVMGQFVFAGWSEDEIPARDPSGDGLSVKAYALIAAAVLVLIGFFSYLIKSSLDESARQYAAYLTSVEAAPGGKEQIIVRQGSHLVLPVNANVEYNAFGPAGLTLKVVDVNGYEAFTPLMLKQNKGDTYYGDLDLKPVVGAPITLHVRSVSQDGDLTYSVTMRPPSPNEDELKLLRARAAVR